MTSSDYIGRTVSIKSSVGAPDQARSHFLYTFEIGGLDFVPVVLIRDVCSYSFGRVQSLLITMKPPDLPRSTCLSRQFSRFVPDTKMSAFYAIMPACPMDHFQQCPNSIYKIDLPTIFFSSTLILTWFLCFICSDYCLQYDCFDRLLYCKMIRGERSQIILPICYHDLC